MNELMNGTLRFKLLIFEKCELTGTDFRKKEGKERKTLF